MSESFVCAGADTVWSLAMDIDVVGAFSDTSDAGAHCDSGTLGLSTGFLVLMERDNGEDLLRHDARS